MSEPPRAKFAAPVRIGRLRYTAATTNRSATRNGSPRSIGFSGLLKERPIHVARWYGLRDAILAALDQLNITLSELAQARGLEAVREAVSRIPPVTSSESEAALTKLYETRPLTDTMMDWFELNNAELRRLFRSPLERLVGDDSFGPGWRRKVRAMDLSDDLADRDDPARNRRSKR